MMLGTTKIARQSIRWFSCTRSRRVQYGFIGLGQMGRHMAGHLYRRLKPDDKLYVYDVVGSEAEAFVNEVTTTNANGGDPSLLKRLDSISDFVTKPEAQLDYVLTMVPEGKHVKAIVSELIENFKNQPDIGGTKTTFLDSSTIDIPTSVEIHNFVAKEIPHFEFMDAPVSGGVAGARKALLSFMLPKKSHDEISPGLTSLLNTMGANIFPCGPQHGSGLAAKLSNNYLLAVTNLAVADSFQLAKSFGLDLKSFAKLVSVSTGKSWASVDNCPIPGAYPKELNLPADDGYKGGFVTKLTRKDLVLATDCAKQYNRFLYLGDISRAWYNKACENEDLANRDLGVLYEWLGELSEKDKVN